MRANLSVMVAIIALASAGPARGSEGSARAGSYSLELVDASGAALRTFTGGRRTYVLGGLGQRYALRLRNGSGRRVEFVASVDGRDVIDGQPAAWQKRGYVVEPYGELVIDGFRLDSATVAAFRFGSVRSSYASRMGDARDVGVVGVAVFKESSRVALEPPAAQPLPWNASERGLATGLNLKSQGSFGAGANASRLAPAAPTADAAPRSPARPGLGTEFGEARNSRVLDTTFERGAASPGVVLTLRYDDRAGLRALGLDLGPPPDSRQREEAQPFRQNTSFAQPPPGWGCGG